jgi:hypothetical protein
MGSTLMTVAEAARLLNRTAQATRALITRYEIEKLYDANGYTFRVRASDVVRVGRRSVAR